MTLKGSLELDKFNAFMGEFLGKHSADLFRSKGVLAFENQDRKYVFQVRAAQTLLQECFVGERAAQTLPQKCVLSRQGSPSVSNLKQGACGSARTTLGKNLPRIFRDGGMRDCCDFEWLTGMPLRIVWSATFLCVPWLSSSVVPPVVSLLPILLQLRYKFVPGRCVLGGGSAARTCA